MFHFSVADFDDLYFSLVRSLPVNASQPLKPCLWNVNKRHGERGQPPNEGHSGMRKNKWLRRIEAQIGIKARGEDGKEGNPPAVSELSCWDCVVVNLDLERSKLK